MLNVPPYQLDLGVADQLVAVVGSDNALRDEQDRDSYRDPFWHIDDRSYDSSTATRNVSVDDVMGGKVSRVH